MEELNNLMLQKKIEILLEMQAKKYEAEINSLKQAISSIAGELNSIKRVLIEHPQQYQQEAPRKKVEIIDCRPESEKKGEFMGGSSKNAEPVRPRYGDYTPQDVSIDKFFYYGNKR